MLRGGFDSVGPLRLPPNLKSEKRSPPVGVALFAMCFASRSGREVWGKSMTWGVPWGGPAGRQTTLRDQVTVAGVGVHSGLPVTITLHPAEADTGIVFIRCGTDGQPDRARRALFRSVTATEFATVLGDKNGPAISTTEQVLAAFYPLRAHN